MMLRYWAITVLLSGVACDAAAPDAPASRDSSADTPDRAAAPPAPPSAEAEASARRSQPSSNAEPYRRKGDLQTGMDEFVFWGWSADGRYYAFETFFAGPGMANCEGEAELTIVDAQTDRYAEDGHVLLTHAKAEADVCDPPDLRAELALRRAPRLRRFGIFADYIGGPISLDRSTDKSRRWSFTPPDGGAVGVGFRVLHGTDDPMQAADGAAFELRIRQPGMSPVVVEPGRRRRPWTMSYGLDEGMVFMGPKGKHVAILVAQRMAIPEGVRTTWMSNGAILR